MNMLSKMRKVSSLWGGGDTEKRLLKMLVII